MLRVNLIKVREKIAINYAGPVGTVYYQFTVYNFFTFCSGKLKAEQNSNHLNPGAAEPDMPCHYVNLYRQPRSSNLTG